MLVFVGALLAWIAAIWVHELGHYFAAKRFGAPPAFLQIGAYSIFSVTIAGVPHRFGLLPFVGYVSRSEGLNLKQQAMEALAGPVASLLTGLPAMFIARGSGSLWLAAFSVFSLLGVVCNLIPVAPSDGWRIAEILSAQRGLSLSNRFRYFVALLFYGGLGVLMML